MKKKPAFENLTPTKQLADGYSMLDIIKASMNRPADSKPLQELPSVKTNLKDLHSKNPSIIWFGHSSYLIHADGKNFLVDPVLSGHASPFSFMIKAFKGSDVYKVADMPSIDYLILTHNHYDHFDYNALKALVPTTQQFIIPTGVSEKSERVSH